METMTIGRVKQGCLVPVFELLWIRSRRGRRHETDKLPLQDFAGFR